MFIHVDLFYSEVVTSMTAIVNASNGQERLEIERLILKKFTVTLSERDYLKLCLIPDVELLSVTVQQSILLYFICMTLEALQTLRELYKLGQLKKYIERLFNSFLIEVQTPLVHLTHISLIDYCESEDFFTVGEVSFSLRFITIYFQRYVQIPNIFLFTIMNKFDLTTI